ncbi:hypothetical protein RA27_07935 [Ruegeria sp. ANG-R]|nr:hypothetical protein RA27_07935 [Ruegeria sp. ANG-R]
MRPILYCYEDVANIPVGVEVRNGNEILSSERRFVNLERNSPAPFSDVFRYHLLKKTNLYWVDTDVYALKPFEFKNDCIYALDIPIINNAVLGLPKDAEALRYLLDWTAQPNINHPYIKRNALTALRPHAAADGSLPIERLPYKALGPLALTRALQMTALDTAALPVETFYPLRPRHVYRSFRNVFGNFDLSRSLCIHLTTGQIYARARSDDGLSLTPDTFLGGLLKQDGVDPKAYPII